MEEPVSKAKSKISKAASTVTFGLINSKDAEEYQQLTAKDITESSESGDDAGKLCLTPRILSTRKKDGRQLITTVYNIEGIPGQEQIDSK